MSELQDLFLPLSKSKLYLHFLQSDWYIGATIAITVVVIGAFIAARVYCEEN